MQDIEKYLNIRMTALRIRIEHLKDLAELFPAREEELVQEIVHTNLILEEFHHLLSLIYEMMEEK